MTTPTGFPGQYYVPTFFAELARLAILLSILPLIVLACYDIWAALATSIATTVMLAIVATNRHVVTFDFARNTISIKTTLVGTFVRQSMYTFRDVRDIAYYTDEEFGRGVVKLLLSDGRKFALQPNINCKDFSEFLLRSIVHQKDPDQRESRSS